MSADAESILHLLESEQRQRTAAVRQMLIDEGRTDLVKDMDARMRAIENGTYGAGGTWHALSDAQRRVLLLVLAGNRRLVRRASGTLYDIVSADGDRIERVAGVKTIRNLADRELLAWDGGAFDPESGAIPTESGRFVAKHGPVNMHWLNGGA